MSIRTDQVLLPDADQKLVLKGWNANELTESTWPLKHCTHQVEAIKSLQYFHSTVHECAWKTVSIVMELCTRYCLCCLSSASLKQLVNTLFLARSHSLTEATPDAVASKWPEWLENRWMEGWKSHYAFQFLGPCSDMTSSPLHHVHVYVRICVCVCTSVCKLMCVAYHKFAPNVDHNSNKSS